MLGVVSKGLLVDVDDEHLAQVAVECVEVLPVEALGEGGRVAVETMPDEPARVEPVHHRVTW